MHELLYPAVFRVRGGRADARLCPQGGGVGLTIAEFIAAVKTASKIGRDATPEELVEAFRRECRLTWKGMQDENNPCSK